MVTQAMRRLYKVHTDKRTELNNFEGKRKRQLVNPE